MTPHLFLLKKHVWQAEHLLENVTPLPEVEESFHPESADIICKHGLSLKYYALAKRWLDKGEGRRLFWIEDRAERLARLLQGEEALAMLQDVRVQIFYVETLIEQEMAIQKIVWLSVYKHLKIDGPEWQARFDAKLLGAKLLASDAADLGLPIFKHLKANFRRPMKRLSSLNGSMKNIPAIIVGAGPSLEKNGHLLADFQDKALILTAGNAIHSIKTRPSLAVLLDPHQSIGKTPYTNVPFCVQGRTHPKTKQCTSGEVLYFPDAHFAFEPWLTKSQLLNTGWTVGNGAVAVALELGCNPIIFVGMDYCYRGSQKYAWRKGGGDMALIQAKNALGQDVWTQYDWLMSVRWMEEMAEEHPETTFINATADGLKMGGRVQTAPLPTPPAEGGVQEKWRVALETALPVELTEERLQTWRASLEACRWDFTPEGIHAFGDGAKALELLLEPLWKIWGPFFERELMTDPHPMPLEDKMQLQKRLFFNRTIDEYIDALNA